MEVRVCASKQITVILAPCSMGYNYTHGHDVIIEVCYCGGIKHYVDVEEIAKMLAESIREDIINIDLITKKKCALIEDLLVYLINKLNNKIRGYRLCSISAKWHWGYKKIFIKI